MGNRFTKYAIIHHAKTFFVGIMLCGWLSGCWAPHCPMKSCHVKMEHRHEGNVYRGGSIFSSRMHNPYWYMTRNSKQAESGGLRTNKDPKTKKKFKKLLPWEKV